MRFTHPGKTGRCHSVDAISSGVCAQTRANSKRQYPSTVKKSLPLLLLPLVSLALAGCASDEEPPHAIGRSVKRYPGESNMYDIADDDVQMDRATRHARKTVGQFIAALQHPAPGETGFAVKKLFVKDGKAEHIWLADVQFSGNRFHGFVDNRPVNIAGLKVGTRVSVNPDEISDWLFIRNGQLVGGYTVRVLMSELSPAEKEDFLKNAKFQISP